MTLLSRRRPDGGKITETLDGKGRPRRPWARRPQRRDSPPAPAPSDLTATTDGTLQSIRSHSRCRRAFTRRPSRRARATSVLAASHSAAAGRAIRSGGGGVASSARFCGASAPPPASAGPPAAPACGPAAAPLRRGEHRLRCLRRRERAEQDHPDHRSLLHNVSRRRRAPPSSFLDMWLVRPIRSWFSSMSFLRAVFADPSIVVIGRRPADEAQRGRSRNTWPAFSSTNPGRAAKPGIG